MSSSAEDGITLVCMPFGQVFSPAIGPSLLKAELATEGMRARVRYFSIRFAELVGHHLYHGLAAQSRPTIEYLAGDWIFSRALFGPTRRNDEYVEQILGTDASRTSDDSGEPVSPALVARILRARERVDDFLGWCLGEVLAGRPKLVGFTSMFQQHVASLALARRIKDERPDVFIVFGGANCADVMGAETLRQFPFVDAVVSGEADLVFPRLARRVLERQPVSGLPGVRTRDQLDAEFASGRFEAAPMVRDLDALPYPDYGDYFEQFRRSRFDAEWRPTLYLETSRGCWWGERMHCTFCGLNGQSMAFRSKSAARALEELSWLGERHPGSAVDMTDNILDMRYFGDVLPGLAARSLRLRLFYEVKANLNKEQLRTLKAAGVRRIQPGIESFSDPVLKLMRKGVTGLQNIQLLKWCKELGVDPGWNVLWGFPGEPPEEYDRMAELVPLLTHLPPPNAYGFIRLDRFSPNFFDAERLGFRDVTPLPSYGYVYTLSSQAVRNLAYYFTFDYREPRDVSGYVAPLERRLSKWQRLREKHDLFSVDMGECLLVWDLRPVSRALLTPLRGPDRVLYQACDRASDLRRLAESLEANGDDPVPAAVIEERLEPLVERGLVVRDGPRYLALAIPLGEYSPPRPAVERFYELARAVGNRIPDGWRVPVTRAAAPLARVDLRRAKSSRCRSPRGRGLRLTPTQFSLDERGDVLIRRRPGR